MTHLDEGTLLTIRDRGLVDADARTHLDDCDVCSSALAATQARAEVVARALDDLGGERPIDIEAAKATVRRRLDARREAPRRTHSGAYRSFGRAALLVLLASGAVYALPNSPLRDWVGGRASVDSPTGDPAAVSAASEGIEVTVPAGGLSIALTSAEVGQRVEISWVEGERAAVVAGSGSHYAVSSARLQVDVAPGDVRIDLPTGPEPITLEVNGRTILRSVEGALDIRGEVVARDANGIVFTVGQG